MKKVLRTIFLGLVLLLGYLFFWPVTDEPFAWQPPEAPDYAGDYAQNNQLQQAEIYSTLPLGKGPEDIAVDSNGYIYGGLDDGKILRYKNPDAEAEIFADTKGRPLGLHYDSLHNLIVADAHKGLLSINGEGEIKVLTDGFEGKSFRFADDLDIGSDGKIYFSDASTIASTENYKHDIMVHGGLGALYVYDPADGSTTQLLDSLYFANGIALSPDQSFVLINETTKYRVLRHWLTGPRKGKTEVFIDNLPGFPDGISSNGTGIFWLALANPRNDLLDQLLPHPFLRKVVMRLPDALRPQPVRYGFVFGLDMDGKVVYNYQDPAGGFAPVTSIQEEDGWLYLGSLSDPAWARIQAPE
ncbi:MAG: SMP-30/gluconolactonase/LRE family protein [Bacteroidota bacterium]